MKGCRLNMLYAFKRLLSAIHDDEQEQYAEQLLDKVYMQLFMNHLLRKQQKDRVLLLIDDALDRKDQPAFLTYTTMLKEIEQC